MFYKIIGFTMNKQLKHDQGVDLFLKITKSTAKGAAFKINRNCDEAYKYVKLENKHTVVLKTNVLQCKKPPKDNQALFFLTKENLTHRSFPRGRFVGRPTAPSQFLTVCEG